MPSVSQRGMRLFDICSVYTCVSSCHSVSCQLNSPGGRALGESNTTTCPKQTPSAPIMPGRPIVRTAKSSCFGNISTRIGPAGLKSHCFESFSIDSFAKGTTYSRITGASSALMRTMTSPSRIVTNLSSESIIDSRL